MHLESVSLPPLSIADKLFLEDPITVEETEKALGTFAKHKW